MCTALPWVASLMNYVYSILPIIFHASHIHMRILNNIVTLLKTNRLVVAPIGSTVINDQGEEITITKTAVGGIPSEGMFCDSKMLGWGSGSEGVAAQVPSDFAVGDAPPKSKPGYNARQTSEESSVPAVEVKGLFEKKLTKEEKKKLAEERRKAKKAAKEAAIGEES